MKRLAPALLGLMLFVACRESETIPASPAPGLVAAQDRAAQSDLRNAMGVAKVYWTDDDTYAGFDAAAAAEIEPGLTFVEGPEVPKGESAVGIAFVSATQVVLNADSESGATFCIADEPSRGGRGTVRGVGTATNFAECEALPEWPGSEQESPAGG